MWRLSHSCYLSRKEMTPGAALVSLQFPSLSEALGRAYMSLNTILPDNSPRSFWGHGDHWLLHLRWGSFLSYRSSWISRSQGLSRIHPWLYLCFSGNSQTIFLHRGEQTYINFLVWTLASPMFLVAVSKLCLPTISSIHWAGKWWLDRNWKGGLMGKCQVSIFSEFMLTFYNKYFWILEPCNSPLSNIFS